MPVTTRYGSTELQVRSVNREKRTIDFIASTFAKDSYGTRIDQNGWVFAKKVPITWAHDDRGFTPSGGRPIGRAINLHVENGQLRGTAEFPRRGIFQFADECFDLAADGFIPATSVGFDPIEEESTSEGGETVPVYRRQKLLEIAFVTIPSNDEAQIDARARALNRGEELDTIKRRLKNVEEMAAELQDAGDDDTDGSAVKEEKVADVEPALPEAINDMAQKMTAEYVQKCISYFERKQKPNKAATRVLSKFYKLRGTEPPADEVAAWKGVEEQLGELIAVVKAEEVKLEEKPAEAPVTEPTPEAPAAPETPIATEPTPETPAPETVPADVPAEVAPEPAAPVEAPAAPVEQPTVEVTPPEAAPTPPTITEPVAEEAPQPARKAFVQLPLPVLLMLREGQNAAVRAAAAEALRQGIPPDRLVGMFSALEN